MSESTNNAVESKVRLWPIWLWILTLLLVAAGGGIVSVYYRNAGQKEIIRVVARSELLAHHWRLLEPDSEFRQVIAAMSDGVKGEDKAEYNCSVKLMMALASSTSTLDPFETSAVKAIESGTEEVWQESWRGVTRYARAVRAKPVCLSCHPVLASGKFAKVDDVLGVVSVEFRAPSDQVRPPIALNVGAK